MSVLLAACGAAAGSAKTGSKQEQAVPEAGAPAAQGEQKAPPPEPEAVAPPAALAQLPPESEMFPGTVFPPQDPGAPFERSKKEGDGKWGWFYAGQDPEKPFKRSEKNVAPDFGKEFVRRIVIHPHDASRFQTLSVAAFDMRHLSLQHQAGRKDVEDLGHSELLDRAGLVPADARASLFAVFNGGFQPQHGRWGILTQGVQLVPPRSDACTVALLQDGTVKIAPWPEFSGILDQIVAYRQTPPCLVHEGEVHPKLKEVDRGPWAGQNADLKTLRRSTVGVSKDGRTLFFGVGSETEPEVLAAGMRHLGAYQAAQLDINWNWTRLFLFEQVASESDAGTSEATEPRFTGALIDDMAKDRGEYTHRASARDFFYLTRRPEKP